MPKQKVHLWLFFGGCDVAQVSVHFLFALMFGNQTYLSINKLMDFILQKEPFSKYWDTSDKKYSILSMVTLYFESKDAVQEDLYGKINIKPIAIKLHNLTTNASKTISHGKLLECFENKQPIVTIKPTKTRMIPNLQKRELAIVEIRTERREYEGHSFYPHAIGICKNQKMVKNILDAKIEDFESFLASQAEEEQNEFV